MLHACRILCSVGGFKSYLCKNSTGSEDDSVVIAASNLLCIAIQHIIVLQELCSSRHMESYHRRQCSCAAFRILSHRLMSVLNGLMESRADKFIHTELELVSTGSQFCHADLELINHDAESA